MLQLAWLVRTAGNVFAEIEKAESPVRVRERMLTGTPPVYAALGNRTPEQSPP